MKLWTLVLALALSLTALNAEAARRLGGGKSVGQQSSNVTQREAARAPTAPAQNAATPAAAPTAAAPAAPKRPWGAMLGGLAAGLGLAWLAHSLGLGEAFGNILLIALLVFAAVAAFGWFMRQRRGAGASGAPGTLAYQGAGPSTYRPENVGNDASARPWERTNANFESARPAVAGGSMIGAALGGSQTWGIPADFDTAGFLGAAKTNFMTLQAAWDRADMATLRSMMTDEMLEEIKGQLAESAAAGPATHKTAVDMLKAELLGIEDRGADYMASVEFSGMITEDASSGPAPFREVWNMTKAKDGSAGWLVAGVQALQ